MALDSDFRRDRLKFRLGAEFLIGKGMNPLPSTKALGLAAVVLILPSVIVAQVPTSQELARTTPAGNYLAGKQANVMRDAAAASAYYRAALRSDSKNPELLELAFYSVLAEGDIDEATRLADRLLAVDKTNRNARLILGVRALKHKQYAAARQQFSQAVRGPITDLTATLLTAWAMQGSGDGNGGVGQIDHLAGPDWYAIFKDFHAGLILDLAGNKKEAGKRFARAYKLEPTALRIVQAYASWLSRNGSKDQAIKVLQEFDKTLPKHPLVIEAMNELGKSGRLPPLVDSPQLGAAEALYGLGAALGRREEELSLANRGLAYLQLALFLNPTNHLALLSLADLYDAMKKPELAVAVYDRIPGESPIKRLADIQVAIDLDSLDRTDEAKKYLERLIASRADNVDAILALGGILRERKQYAECADVYSRAIAAIPTPDRSNWTVFYFRGICYERAKQWAKAEADLKKALELYPEQPHVLNYLGYSWIDQGINLDEGMRMIKKSVEQRPDDGYIVDSLGWAYFRLGNYEEAVKQLDRAVELKPTDPTINDHLGDAYWKVGRTLEAKFQWSHARDLKPEADELAKIDQKLKSGLTEETSSADATRKPGDGG
jgi:tetratricopeptide (TPR) repeat protein